MPLSNFKPDRYSALLDEKIAALLPAFNALGAPPPQLLESPVAHYRMRAEFHIKHIDGEPHYVMFPKGGEKRAVVIDDFPIACRPIADLIQPLRQAIAASESLSRRLFQVEFLSGLSGELLVSLIYHRPLDEAWQNEAQRLAEDFGISLIGRSRKQKIVLGQDYIVERLQADERNFQFRHYENSFTQPNAVVNQSMISWACQQAQRMSGDLLELYCGCGNFTLPLAKYFPRVLATEVSKVSTRAAQENCELNGVRNIEFARLSAEEISQALQGVRPFRRLSHVNLDDFNLKALFVDPPRAGLDDFTRQFASGFDHILYISCNPETLLRDLEHFCHNHSIVALAFFDQFPYTGHMESGVLLESK